MLRVIAIIASNPQFNSEGRCQHEKYNLAGLFAVIMIFAVSSFAGAEPKIRMAVMNVTEYAKLLKQADMIANNFIRVMAKSDAFSIVEREELELIKIRNEQKNNSSKSSDVNRAVSLAKIMNCQYFVLSSLVYDVAPIVGVRVVDAATSSIIFADIEFPDLALSEKSGYSLVISASSKLAYKFLEELTGAQSLITDIDGSEITINRGSLSGVRKGNLYLVYSGTKKKYDDIAVIRVKDVRTNFSYAELVKNAGNISVLRISDTIAPISKEEANTIIRRKKFVKSRPAGDMVADNKIQHKKSWSSYEDCLKDANQGNVYAQYNVALMYIGGWDVKRDYAKAAEWCRKAADNGYAKAQSYLGYMYAHGLGVKQNYSKAVELYRKVAEQGNDVAQNNLGYMYQHSLGVKQDYAKAAELYRKAAAQGNESAKEKLKELGAR